MWKINTRKSRFAYYVEMDFGPYKIGVAWMRYPWVNEVSYKKSYFSFWERLCWAGRFNTGTVQVRFLWLALAIKPNNRLPSPAIVP